MDGYLRIGYGEQPEYMRQGLNRVRDFLVEIGAAAGSPSVRAGAPAASA